jgi:hypothetical protein
MWLVMKAYRACIRRSAGHKPGMVRRRELTDVPTCSLAGGERVCSHDLRGAGRARPRYPCCPARASARPTPAGRRGWLDRQMVRETARVAKTSPAPGCARGCAGCRSPEGRAQPGPEPSQRRDLRGSRWRRSGGGAPGSARGRRWGYSVREPGQPFSGHGHDELGIGIGVHQGAPPHGVPVLLIFSLTGVLVRTADAPVLDSARR